MLVRLLLLLLLLVPRPALAQDSAATANALGRLDAAAREYRAIDQAFSARTDAAERRDLQARAVALNQAASGAAGDLADQLALIDQRVAQLGPVTPGVVEAPDIRQQRRALTLARSTIDSAVKRGRLIAVEADQLATEIGDSQADAFSEAMSQRTATPLGPTFWTLLGKAMPRDMRRLGAFVGDEGAAIAAGLHGRFAWLALVGLLAAATLMLPVRAALARLGRRLMIERAPANRLRRSGLALWRAASGMLLPGLAAMALFGGLRGAGMVAPAWAPLAAEAERLAFVAGLLVALATALLQPHQPSWRLPPVRDEGAQALRRWVRVAAGAVVVSRLGTSFVDAAGLSGPATETAGLVSVLLYLVVTSAILRVVGTLRARREAESGEEVEASAAGVGAVSLVAWIGVIASLGALALGYLSLALLVSRLILWLPIVGTTLYLLLIVTDDLCTGLIQRDSRLGALLVRGFGIRASLVDQAGVFLSALIRLLLVLFALTLVFRPFGSNFDTLFAQASSVSRGVTVGEITIAPAAILRALAVLAGGIFVVRLAQRWLTERYLPATELDAGARNSIAMVARYTGLILAMLWALASLGIGIERIALLLSALSVGIGFGLQAITQNFVSGLILLAERPVKIGDWVRIGNDEGDVKRISVRATEIQIADRSTLIVPNSELITKTILNKTLSDPIGRFQLVFSIPIGADLARTREMVMAIYSQTPAVLDEPAPVFFVDSIADGRINLNSFAYVKSPRDTYPTRSAILFRLLDELPKAGIELGTTPTQMMILGDGRAAVERSEQGAAPV